MRSFLSLMSNYLGKLGKQANDAREVCPRVAFNKSTISHCLMAKLKPRGVNLIYAPFPLSQYLISRHRKVERMTIKRTKEGKVDVNDNFIAFV